MLAFKANIRTPESALGCQASRRRAPQFANPPRESTLKIGRPCVNAVRSSTSDRLRLNAGEHTRQATKIGLGRKPSRNR